MHYKVFYFFERSGESVSSASALEMSAGDIRKQLLRRLQGEDDYLGILDVQGNILQIIPEPDRSSFWVELPMDAAKASYGRHMSMEELDDLICSLPRLFDQEQIPSLNYKPW